MKMGNERLWGENQRHGKFDIVRLNGTMIEQDWQSSRKQNVV